MPTNASARDIQEMLPLQPGDLADTTADNSRAHALLGYRPKVGLAQGVRATVDWYREYYAV